MRIRAWFVAGTLVATLSACSGPAGPAAQVPDTVEGSSSTSSTGQPSRARPLAGRTIVIDPGHQVGNRNFPAQINALVDIGGSRKPCNTTGTATDDGYPEATLTWQVARSLTRRLEKLGATVVLTRSSNSARKWGPCVDVRGRAGNRIGADLKLSIHADGSLSRGAHGFHVIAPRRSAAQKPQVQARSLRLAKQVRAALRHERLPAANYIAGGDGLDVRGDLGTLNLAKMPTVMVELGNMRSAADAARMTRKVGRERYARALTRAIRSHLG
ncbi:N-acetylmuramoyl-L-alanine amidase [Nocardioides sp. Bht2]|uniref:N-acetylmuramoyl-L-alanine amidase n=1 Tax=Nocardioides sp. Bht2 TaxID=3392297 RepID=UPI0039B6B7A6